MPGAGVASRSARPSLRNAITQKRKRFSSVSDPAHRYATPSSTSLPLPRKWSCPAWKRRARGTALAPNTGHATRLKPDPRTFTGLGDGSELGRKGTQSLGEHDNAGHTATSQRMQEGSSAPRVSAARPRWQRVAVASGRIGVAARAPRADLESRESGDRAHRVRIACGGLRQLRRRLAMSQLSLSGGRCSTSCALGSLAAPRGRWRGDPAALLSRLPRKHDPRHFGDGGLRRRSHGAARRPETTERTPPLTRNLAFAG
jgi:hypothetical protein